MPPLWQYFSRVQGRRVHSGLQRARIMDPTAFLLQTRTFLGSHEGAITALLDLHLILGEGPVGLTARHSS
jgi:hypothetical protein